MSKKNGVSTAALLSPSARMDPTDSRARWLILSGLCAAMLGLSSLATWLTWHEVRRLPMLQVMWHDQKDLSDRLVRTMREGSPAVREAVALWDNSLRFTKAWRKNTDGYALEREIAAMAAGEQSQFRLLQILAARFLAVEQRNQTPESAWAGLKKLIDDAATARSFAHLQPVLCAAWAAALCDAGLGPGTARAQAEEYVSQPHGPLAEFLAPRLTKLAATRDAAGDPAGAAACRSILYRWLREWTLEPTAINARMLAADLLSNFEGEFSTGGEHAQSAAALRAWRSKYRAAPSILQGALPLDIGQSSAFAFSAHLNHLLHFSRLAWRVAALAAAVAVAIIAMGLAVVAPKELSFSPALIAIGIVLPVALVRLGEPLNVPPLEDLRGDFSRFRYYWHFLLWAFLMMGAALLIVGYFSRFLATRSSVAARLSIVATVAGMALAASSLLQYRRATETRSQLDQAVVAAFDDPAAAVGAPLPADVIEKLKTWNP